MFLFSPLQNLALWPLTCAAVIAIFIFLIIRLLLRGGRENKNRTLTVAFACCCMGIWLSSCSEHDKLSDPKPTSSVNHNDVALPEVVVIGHREEIQSTYIPDLNYSGGFVGSGEPAGSGGGGTGGTGSGGGGFNPDGTPRDTSPPLFDPNDPNSGNPPTKEVLYLQVITSRLNPLQDLRVIVDIRNGQVNGASSYISGMTAGDVFTQDSFSPVSSTTSGDYVIQVAWHVSYQLFLEGVGTLRVGAPFVSTVSYDASTGTTTVKTVSYP